MDSDIPEISRHLYPRRIPHHDNLAKELVSRQCPICLSRGIQSKLKFSHTSLQVSMLVCEARQCPFPLPDFELIYLHHDYDESDDSSDGYRSIPSSMLSNINSENSVSHVDNSDDDSVTSSLLSHSAGVNSISQVDNSDDDSVTSSLLSHSAGVNSIPQVDNSDDESITSSQQSKVAGSNSLPQADITDDQCITCCLQTNVASGNSLLQVDITDDQCIMCHLESNVAGGISLPQVAIRENHFMQSMDQVSQQNNDINNMVDAIQHIDVNDVESMSSLSDDSLLVSEEFEAFDVGLGVIEAFNECFNKKEDCSKSCSWNPNDNLQKRNNNTSDTQSRSLKNPEVIVVPELSAAKQSKNKVIDINIENSMKGDSVVPDQGGDSKCASGMKIFSDTEHSLSEDPTCINCMKRCDGTSFQNTASTSSFFSEKCNNLNNNRMLDDKSHIILLTENTALDKVSLQMDIAHPHKSLRCDSNHEFQGTSDEDISEFQPDKLISYSTANPSILKSKINIPLPSPENLGGSLSEYSMTKSNSDRKEITAVKKYKPQKGFSKKSTKEIKFSKITESGNSLIKDSVCNKNESKTMKTINGEDVAKTNNETENTILQSALCKATVSQQEVMNECDKKNNFCQKYCHACDNTVWNEHSSYSRSLKQTFSQSFVSSELEASVVFQSVVENTEVTVTSVKDRKLKMEHMEDFSSLEKCKDSKLHFSTGQNGAPWLSNTNQKEAACNLSNSKQPNKMGSGRMWKDTGKRKKILGKTIFQNMENNISGTLVVLDNTDFTPDIQLML